jgi:hypothetical protein
MTKTHTIFGFTNRASVLAAVAMALAPQVTRAQTVPSDFLVLDNFTKGAQSVEVAVSGTKNSTYTEPVPGQTIIGGSRYILVYVPGTYNPYSQPMYADVVPAPANGQPPAFISWFGYGGLGRVELLYENGTSLLNANLSGYERLRVVFGTLPAPIGLNFNLEAWASNGYDDCGINVGPQQSQFTVDFPMSAYTVTGGAALNWSDTTALLMIFQAGLNFTITGFYAIPTGAVLDGPTGSINGPATFTCTQPS